MIRRLLIPVLVSGIGLHAAPLDDIGVTALRSEHPELTGAGVTVGVAEAGPSYQVNPATTGHPASDFQYYDTDHPYGGAGHVSTPSLHSGHANSVAAAFFKTTTGAAPGVPKIENFDASYFFNRVVARTTTTPQGTFWTPIAIDSRVVNQSFIFTGTTASEEAQVNRFYDAYARQFNVLFVNGSGNGVAADTPAPASSFNGIAVGRLDGNHAGRVQLVAPGGATSFTTPYVSGVATLLQQAADLGQANEIDADPTDARVTKVLLLNGATKPETWTQTETDPLDATFGAGLVNAKNSHDTLAAGQQLPTLATNPALGTVDTSTSFAGTTPLASLQGWDLRNLTASTTQDAAQHYFFDLTGGGLVDFTLTATITWFSLPNLAEGTNAISNFDLHLVDVDTQTVALSSSGTGENIEHLYGIGLAAARYDLQVVLRGGSGAPVPTDSYALAYSFAEMAVTAVPESKFFLALPVILAVVIVGRRRRKPIV